MVSLNALGPLHQALELCYQGNAQWRHLREQGAFCKRDKDAKIGLLLVANPLGQCLPHFDHVLVVMRKFAMVSMNAGMKHVNIGMQELGVERQLRNGRL